MNEELTIYGEIDPKTASRCRALRCPLFSILSRAHNPPICAVYAHYQHLVEEPPHFPDSLITKRELAIKSYQNRIPPNCPQGYDKG